ncbi:MAG: NAD(P)/FAD-dependent oxidoreductase [Peptococcaceae bacterium]|nr:NAD(P)/FAD-dependent oxidoreductase [Peptococcaceae bacterium]
MLTKYDVIIVGAGPAGIFAALELVKDGSEHKILMIEKGPGIKKRVCPSQNSSIGGCRHCSPCATVCGWGGAGAFSDGKLTLSTEVGGSLEEYVGVRELESLISYVDRLYLRFGAPDEVYGVKHQEEFEDIKRKAVLAGLRLVPLPIRHLGTGRCGEILQLMYEYLAPRVDIRTGTQVTRIVTKDNRAVGVETADGQTYAGDYLVVAPGREGSEWLAKEARRLGLRTRVNPVDIGVRVELPAVVLEPLTNLFYELKCTYVSQTFEDRVRTFCMNPHGSVVMENNDGVITVNGHSHAYQKTDNTNFAILVSKNFTEPFREPIAYGRYIASLANLLGGNVIVQRLGDLINGRRSTPKKLKRCLVTPTLPEATPGDLSLVFPYRHMLGIIEMLKALDKIAPGVYSRDTLLYGAEVKYYSSRLALNEGLETPIANLFAAGDGAGVTRGLVQASASGVVVAREILKRLS